MKSMVNISATLFIIMTFLLVGGMNNKGFAVDAVQTMSAEKIKEERAYTLGTAAFMWGFPMNELYRVRSKALSANGASVNSFKHIKMLFTPAIARNIGVVRANSNTLYSLAWLDLSVEPMVLEFPAIHGRYFTFNYIDYYQNLGNISNSTTGRKKGSYAFVGPDWRGVLPEGVTRVDVATNTVWIIGRTEVKGPDDVKNVNLLQDQYSLTSLREYQKGNKNSVGNNSYSDWPVNDVEDPLHWFALLNEGLRRNPPRGDDLTMLGMFESIGVGPNMDFDPHNLDEATAAGLRRAVLVGPLILTAEFDNRLGQKINNWQVTTDLGSWVTPRSHQTDFMIRAAIAKEAQPGQSNSQAIYSFLTVDGDGRLLSGTDKYTFRFEKGQLPPVDAFWSLSLYDKDGFSIENSINRNQIGTYDNLEMAADGSITIYVQSENPGIEKDSNWLPAPEDDFTLTLRLFNPKQTALTLDWVVPAVNRMK